MSIGAGLIEGTRVSNLYDITPDADLYEGHTGMVYDGQDGSGGGSIGFYETRGEGDTLDFRVPDAARDWDETAMVFNTVFGTIDFDVQTVGAGETLVSEQSGFDSDVWVVRVPDGVTLRLTDFDTGDGVDGQQAAIYPYVGFFEIQ